MAALAANRAATNQTAPPIITLGDYLDGKVDKAPPRFTLCMVIAVEEGAPAQAAKIMPGDFMLGVKGRLWDLRKTITSNGEFSYSLYIKNVADMLDIEGAEMILFRRDPEKPTEFSAGKFFLSDKLPAGKKGFRYNYIEGPRSFMLQLYEAYEAFVKENGLN